MRGSWRAKSRKGEPRPDRGKPTAPAQLTDAQKQIWKRLTAELDSMGVLTKVDGWQLERYCVFLDRWRQCERFIAEKGLTYTLMAEAAGDADDPEPPPQFVGQLTDGRYVVGFKTYPQVKHSLDLHKALKEIEDRFGLTPAARSRLTAGDDDDAAPADPFEELMRGRKKA